MVQAERDTVDVVTFLKKEDMKKDDQVWFSILAMNFEYSCTVVSQADICDFGNF